MQAVSLISLYAGNLHYYPLYLLLTPRRRSVERELVHIEDVNQPRNHTAAHSNDVVQLVSLVDVGLPVNLVRELCGNAARTALAGEEPAMPRRGVLLTNSIS